MIAIQVAALLLLSAVAVPAPPSWTLMTYEDALALPGLKDCHDLESRIHRTFFIYVHDDNPDSLPYFKAADILLDKLDPVQRDLVLNKVVTNSTALRLAFRLSSVTTASPDLEFHQQLLMSLIKKLRAVPAFTNLGNGFAGLVTKCQKKNWSDNTLSDFALDILKEIPAEMREIPPLSGEIVDAINALGISTQTGGPFADLLPHPLNQASHKDFDGVDLWNVIYGKFAELVKENPRLVGNLLLFHEGVSDLTLVPDWYQLSASELRFVERGFEFTYTPDKFVQVVEGLIASRKFDLVEVMLESEYAHREFTNGFFDGVTRPLLESLVKLFVEVRNSELVESLLSQYRALRQSIADRINAYPGPDLHPVLEQAKKDNSEGVVAVLIKYDDVLGPHYIRDGARSA